MFMMWKILFLGGLQCLPIYAQITFSSPSTGQVISGGAPFTVACGDSLAAPYFSQMSNFSIALFAGSYSSLVSAFSTNNISIL